jgi:hypothetical protein
MGATPESIEMADTKTSAPFRPSSAEIGICSTNESVKEGVIAGSGASSQMGCEM